MNDIRRSRRLYVGLLSLALVLVACSTAATPPTMPPASAPPDAPVTAPPSDGSGDPGGNAGAKLIVPKPGQLDVHDVPANRSRPASRARRSSSRPTG